MLSDAFRTAVSDNFDAALQVRYRRHDRRRRARRQGRRRAAGAFPQPPFRPRLFRALLADHSRAEPSATALPDLAFAVRPQHPHPPITRKIGRLHLGPRRRSGNQRLRVLAQRVEFPIPATARPERLRAPTPSWSPAIFPQSTHEIAHFNGTLIWSFVAPGPGTDRGDLHPGAHRPACRCGGVSEALARIRDGAGAPAGRTFPRRDRAAGRRTQQPDRAQRRSGRPRPHPCLQPRAFPEDAA